MFQCCFRYLNWCIFFPSTVGQGWCFETVAVLLENIAAIDIFRSDGLKAMWSCFLLGENHTSGRKDVWTLPIKSWDDKPAYQPKPDFAHQNSHNSWIFAFQQPNCQPKRANGSNVKWQMSLQRESLSNDQTSHALIRNHERTVHSWTESLHVPDRTYNRCCRIWNSLVALPTSLPFAWHLSGPEIPCGHCQKLLVF